MKSMTAERKAELLNKALEYISDHAFDDGELRNALTKYLGMTDHEIYEMGFDLDVYDVTFVVTYTVTADSKQEAVSKAEEKRQANIIPDDEHIAAFVNGVRYA